MKVTKEQFILFKRACQYWVKEFGLTDYEIDYEYRRINSYYFQGYRALVKYDTDVRAASIILYRNWNMGKFADKKIPNSEIERTAFHEVYHLLLADLLEAPKRKRLKEEHRLIAKLSSLLLKCS